MSNAPMASPCVAYGTLCIVRIRTSIEQLSRLLRDDPLELLVEVDAHNTEPLL